MGQNPHLLRKWGDGPGGPAQREHLLDGDSPGPELVPGQRSFLKANSTLLHPYHVHPRGARLGRAPRPQAVASPDCRPASPLCCRACHSMAGPIRQGPRAGFLEGRDCTPAQGCRRQRVSLRLGRRQPRGGASSSGATEMGLRDWFGSPASAGSRPCPQPTLPSLAARSSHQHGCHGALTTQGVPKLLHDPGSVAQGCCQTGRQEKRVPRPKGDTRNTGDLSEPRLCGGAACPHEGLGRRAASQTQLSRPGPPGGRALGPPGVKPD